MNEIPVPILDMAQCGVVSYSDGQAYSPVRQTSVPMTNFEVSPLPSSYEPTYSPVLPPPSDPSVNDRLKKAADELEGTSKEIDELQKTGKRRCSCGGTDHQLPTSHNCRWTQYYNKNNKRAKTMGATNQGGSVTFEIRPSDQNQVDDEGVNIPPHPGLIYDDDNRKAEGAAKAGVSCPHVIRISDDDSEEESTTEPRVSSGYTRPDTMEFD
jgi:hypothetical protein